MKLTLHTA